MSPLLRLVLLAGAMSVTSARAQGEPQPQPESQVQPPPQPQPALRPPPPPRQPEYPAQESCARYETPERTLRGHRFLFPNLQDSPFIITYFGFREGLSLIHVDQLSFPDFPARSARSISLEQNLDLQVKILPILGLYVTGTASVAVGTNPNTLIVRPGSYNLRLQGGAVVRLVRSEASGSQLSARAFGGVGSGRVATLLPLLESLVSSPIASVSNLFNSNLSQLLLVKTRDTNAGASLNFAQGITKALGFQAALVGDYSWASSDIFSLAEGQEVTTQAKQFHMGVAAALTLDFRQWKVPLALLGEYRFDARQLQSPGDDPWEHDHTVAAGLYYSERADLQLGISVLYSHRGTPTRLVNADGIPGQTGVPSTRAGQFSIRYIW